MNSKTRTGSAAAPVSTTARPASKNGRQTIVELAAQAIVAGILEGRYAPGQRLVEADLTRELGISRNPLREALGRVAADGLVQIEPFRGAIVARPSRREVADLFEMRECLEGWAARRAAARITVPGLRERTRRIAAPLLAAGKTAPRAEDYLIENRKFHQMILELAGNVYLPRLLDLLQFPIFQAAFFRVYDAKLYQASAADHRAIFDAIIRGDKTGAEAAVHEHIRRTSALVQSLPDVLFRPDESHLAAGASGSPPANRRSS
jgi:DNA-binding GntR family transcriptional regulator